MDRKGFLQRMFGAAVVASMPSVLVDKIESLPHRQGKPADFTIKKPEFIDSRTNIAVDKYGDNCMYLYKNEHLLGYSYENNIEVKRQPIFIASIEDISPLSFPMPASWNISMNRVKWLEGWGLLAEYIMSGIPITMLLRKEDYIIQGEVLITERSSCHIVSGWVDIKCQGVGALTITVEK